MRQDFRRTLRALLRAPLFTSVAVVTLALGIGASTTIFSVVHGVLLKPLPFEEADRLVGVWHTAVIPGIRDPVLNQGPATYLTYRDEGRTFEDIALWDGATVSVTGVRDPERLPVLLVTDAFLPVLRVKPHLGRAFTREDDSPSTPERVMLGYAYWERAFSASPDAVGRQVVVDGRPREIIGVLPRDFRFLDRDADLLVPFRLNRAEVRLGDFSYQAVARLEPGVTLEQANADIARMIPMIYDRFPAPPGFTREIFNDIRMGPRVRPLAADVIGDVGRVLWVLLGTVGIVLLIACANVANLFLIRAEGRQQELAVRSALGARRRGIAGQLLLESLLLAVAGGAVGLLLAHGGIRLLLSMAPEGLPRQGEIGMEPVVLAFAVALSLAAGVVFGLLPLLHFSTPRVLSGLKDGGRAASDSRSRNRARNLLVVSEIALALVLLVGSGLMLRTFQELLRVNPGFVHPEEVLTFRLAVPEALVPDAEAVTRTHEEIARRIGQIPGVRTVGMSSSLTMDGFDSNDAVFLEDFPPAPGQLPGIRRQKWVSPAYFETMGNKLIAGRSMTWQDIYDLSRVAMVTEAFTREYWKSPAQAVGRRIKTAPNQAWREIVGVVGNEYDDGVARRATAIVYWPMMMADWRQQDKWAARAMGYAVRTATPDSPTLLKDVQTAVWAVNPALPLASVRTLEDIQATSMAQTSFALVMLAIASVVALLLGVVGIYGVIAYMATQRTREIGIRMALGAAPQAVTRLFVRHGLVLTAAGLVIGLGAAAGLTRLMAALLFGVSAWDPATYVAVTIALAAIALLASYIPAYRASRLDPIEGLRAQ
ncbi:MAG TPA: ABC transporter permease [Vicinamibacterales bacterium]|nr:ABC transporter permease [Vicinamibacterales bacterium]